MVLLTTLLEDLPIVLQFLPSMHPKYIVVQARDSKYSYEAATFTFYFPTQTEELCVDKSQCILMR